MCFFSVVSFGNIAQAEHKEYYVEYKPYHLCLIIVPHICVSSEFVQMLTGSESWTGWDPHGQFNEACYGYVDNYHASRAAGSYCEKFGVEGGQAESLETS